MKKNKTTKSKKQRRALVLSLVLALLIVIGATFAWFTGTDEVTNKLTASNTYGVYITENYEPKSQWLVGQSIAKEVAVTNTGNIASFVEVELSNAITVTVEDESSTRPTSSTYNTNGYVEISTTEAIAMQAGGLLVWDGQSAASPSPTSIDAGELYATSSNVSALNSKGGWGVYIFQRTDTSGNTTYAGYYALNVGGTDVKYFAINATGAGGKVGTDYTLKITETLGASDGTITYKYGNIRTDTSDAGYIVATYSRDDTTTDDDIIINIYLNDVICSNNANYADNYGNYSWTFNYSKSTSEKAYFYYNKVLAAGATTSNLVTKVEIDSSVKSTAYVDFDYDLVVDMNNVQATAEEDGTVLATTVLQSEVGSTWLAYVAYDSDVTATLGSDGTITGDNKVKWTMSN